MKERSSSAAAAIPDKLYFKIGEVSRLAGVPAHVLRFWEAEFPRIAPKRTDAGQRLYSRREVELILEIKDLLHRRKFTIAGAKKWLTGEGRQHGAQQMELGFEGADREVLLRRVREGLASLEKMLES